MFCTSFFRELPSVSARFQPHSFGGESGARMRIIACWCLLNRKRSFEVELLQRRTALKPSVRRHVGELIDAQILAACSDSDK